ncbi:matrixin family metalloprotease [Patulibacter americanus]|uniref:matrixin family metalloprotease n=1 Tax=Patulibacter americanus TaxID=588672 RepID=UPI00040F7AC5|nr:matrixin family metalloprotease [Patulibacter americanus]
MLKKVTSTAACAAAMSLAMVGMASAAAAPVPQQAQASKASSKALCSDPQGIADQFGDGAGSVPVDGSAKRRTLYLDDASYAVQRCRADGTLQKATKYELRTFGKKRTYVPTDHMESTPEGVLTAGTVDYISPEDPRATRLVTEALADGALAEAPADEKALTAPASAEHDHERRPAQTRAYPPSHPRCFNANFNTGRRFSMWPNRGVTYYTNLPNGSWEGLINGGRATIDDRWNECGFAVPWRTQSTWGGSVPGLGVNLADGISAILVGNGTLVQNYCQAAPSLILACINWQLAPEAVAGPGGQTRRIVSFDMLFNYEQPYTDGALPGFYDVWSVAAHEWGHAYGLDHVSGGAYDDWLVMYPYSFQNDIKQRWNSQGDLNGIGALYPN